VFVVIVVAANSFDMFNANELEKGVGHLVDLAMEV